MHEHEIELINSQSEFYLKFHRTGFFERLAHWSRLLLYGFLLLHLFSIILNMVVPFANTPPDLFFQLLFLLLVWGGIEVIGIPLEAIHDTCIIDFQRNWICYEQSRFFFNRQIVLASFNQIKGIAVSSRPGPVNNAVFSNSENRFAIVILDLDNQLIAITDYNLSLDEANEIVHDMHFRHLSGAQAVHGMPGYEVFYDPQICMLNTRPAVRSIRSCFKSISMPILQAATAITGSGIVITATIIILSSIALGFFNSDLKIARQPIIQFFAQAPDIIDQVEILPPPQTPPPEISSAVVDNTDIPIEAVSTSSTAITLDLFKKAVVSEEKNDTAALIETAKNSEDNESPPDPVIFPEKAPEEIVHVDPLYPVASQIPLIPLQRPGTQVEVQTAEAILPQDTRKDTSDASSGSAPEVIPYNSAHKEKAEKMNVTQDTLVHADQTDFINRQNLASRIPGSDNLAISAISRNISQKKEALETDILSSDLVASETADQTSGFPIKTIIPGKGLERTLEIGQNTAILRRHLGPPLHSQKRAGLQQHIFKGITILSKPGPLQPVESIIITAPNNPVIGTFVTRNNLTIGSSMQQVLETFGAPETISGKPGLHFFDKGISFFPSSTDNSKIGAIQIYQPGTCPL